LLSVNMVLPQDLARPGRRAHTAGWKRAAEARLVPDL